MDESGLLKEDVTDLSPIMSSFLSTNGTRYHLHPELTHKGDEAESCFLCVTCLQLVNEENSIANVDSASPEAGVKQAKRNASLQKNREKSMCIAAGFDYGVLSRIQDLTRLSILENSLLCPHRAYYLTITVKPIRSAWCKVASRRHRMFYSRRACRGPQVAWEHWRDSASKN
jgi:hypothetical protein